MAIKLAEKSPFTMEVLSLDPAGQPGETLSKEVMISREKMKKWLNETLENSNTLCVRQSWVGTKEGGSTWYIGDVVKPWLNPTEQYELSRAIGVGGLTWEQPESLRKILVRLQKIMSESA